MSIKGAIVKRTFNSIEVTGFVTWLSVTDIDATRGLKTALRDKLLQYKPGYSERET